MDGSSGGDRGHRFRAHVEGVDYGALDSLVGYAVRRAQLTIVEAFDRAFAAEGITTQRFSALVLITRNAGLTQVRLAELMGASAPQVTVVINSLVELGYVERRAVNGDRRARALIATDLGARRMAVLETEVAAHDQAVSAALSPAERAVLLKLLERIGAPGPGSDQESSR